MGLLTRASTAARQQSQENKNQRLAAKGGLSKVQPNQQAAKRRALGDVSNVLGNRAQETKVGGATKPKPGGAAAVAGGVVTRRRSGRLPANQEEKAAPAPVPSPVAAAPAPPPEPTIPRVTRLQARRASEGSASVSACLESGSGAVASRSRRSSNAASAPQLPDIDMNDRNNFLAVTDYVGDIYEYFSRVEGDYLISAGYMANQEDINGRMRKILIDWLVDVHLKFKLLPETLYLSVNLIDRFLQEVPTIRKDLQLVGMVGMLIASKYEDIWAPEVRDFVYVCDKAYTREQILSMEKKMLSQLGYKLSLPTSYNFQARFLKAANVHREVDVCNYVLYMLELSMVEESMLGYKPSQVAAAATYLAMTATEQTEPYPKALRQHSGYTLGEVIPIARKLLEFLPNASTGSHTAVHRKYSMEKYHEVAKLSIPTF
eukprot:gene25201-10841_t